MSTESTVSAAGRRRTWVLGVVVLAACTGLGGFFLARQLDREAPVLASGTWLPRPKVIETLALIDARGRPFTNSDLTSAPSLVYFGFTRCPDVCPTTLVKLAQALKLAAVGPLRVLFVTVDPERDTPAVVGLYAHAFDPSFQGVTGTPEAIRSVAKNFAVAFNRVDLPGGDYTMDHSAVLFLVDARGIVAVFTPPFEAPALAADLRRAAPHLVSAAGQPPT